MKSNKALFLSLLLSAGLAALTRTALEAAPARALTAPPPGELNHGRAPHSGPPYGAFKVPKGAVEAALVLPDGFKVKVELALTPREQAKGLMFRKELAADRGMLFVFKEGGEKNFWMKNTFVELDIVFMDKELKIVKVFHRVTPARPGQSELEAARAAAPAMNVLELAGGTARKHAVKPGARLKISFPPPPAKKAPVAPASVIK